MSGGRQEDAATLLHEFTAIHTNTNTNSYILPKVVTTVPRADTGIATAVADTPATATATAIRADTNTDRATAVAIAQTQVDTTATVIRKGGNNVVQPLPRNFEHPDTLEAGKRKLFLLGLHECRNCGKMFQPRGMIKHQAHCTVLIPVSSRLRKEGEFQFILPVTTSTKRTKNTVQEERQERKEDENENENDGTISFPTTSPPTNIDDDNDNDASLQQMEERQREFLKLSSDELWEAMRNISKTDDDTNMNSPTPSLTTTTTTTTTTTEVKAQPLPVAVAVSTSAMMKGKSYEENEREVIVHPVGVIFKRPSSLATTIAPSSSSVLSSSSTRINHRSRSNSNSTNSNSNNNSNNNKRRRLQQQNPKDDRNKEQDYQPIELGAFKSRLQATVRLLKQQHHEGSVGTQIEASKAIAVTKITDLERRKEYIDGDGVATKAAINSVLPAAAATAAAYLKRRKGQQVNAGDGDGDGDNAVAVAVDVVLANNAATAATIVDSLLLPTKEGSISYQENAKQPKQNEQSNTDNADTTDPLSVPTMLRKMYHEQLSVTLDNIQELGVLNKELEIVFQQVKDLNCLNVQLTDTVEQTRKTIVVTMNMAKNKLKEHTNQRQSTNKDDTKEETGIVTLLPPSKEEIGVRKLQQIRQQYLVEQQQQHRQKKQALQQKRQLVQQKKDQSQVLFPQKLMEMLTRENVNIICWLPQGNAFRIPDLCEFNRDILPRYFQHIPPTVAKLQLVGSVGMENKILASFQRFQRQLNLYGFIRVTNGKEPGGFAIPLAYRHDFFHRDHPDRCLQLTSRNPLTRLKRAEAVAEQSSNEGQEQQSGTPRPVLLDSSNLAVSLSSASNNVGGSVTTNTTSTAAAINNASCSSSGQKRKVVIDMSCLSDSGDDDNDSDDIVNNSDDDTNDNDDDDDSNIHDHIPKRQRQIYRTFDDRLSDLANYERKHGNTNIPIKYKGYGNLGRWINLTRNQYKLYKENKPSTLTKERARKLEKIDFPLVYIRHYCNGNDDDDDNNEECNDDDNDKIVENGDDDKEGCNDDDNGKIADNRDDNDENVEHNDDDNDGNDDCYFDNTSDDDSLVF